MKILLSLISLILTTHLWAGTTEDEAKKAGCTLLAGDDQVCLYPELSLKGFDAIAKINDLLGTKVGKTTYVEGNVEKCVVMWSSVALESWSVTAPASEQPLHGELKFVDPLNGKPLLGFWFGKELSYSYQYVDKAFNVGENDFYVDHIFKVQGAANKKYEMVIYEDGDAAAGMKLTVNGQQKTINEFCETEF